LKVCEHPVVGEQAAVVHGFWSSGQTTGVETQAPAAQWSAVHSDPSEQALALLGVKTQPAVGLQLSSVQGLLSLHTLAMPGVHTPVAHTSPTVHRLPSSQPDVVAVNTHWPVARLQVSSVHEFESLQVLGVPAQMPRAHWSALVHALPSSQATVLNDCPQPVEGTHTAVVHTLPSSGQVIGVAAHTPAWQ
jgi:hypothetical protein